MQELNRSCLDEKLGILVCSQKPIRYRSLTDLIKENRCSSILEIGTGTGVRSEKMILAALENHSRIWYYGFDLFDKVPDEIRDAEAVPPSRLRSEKEIRELLEGKGIEVKLYPGYSRDTLPEFIKEDITPDFVFIDGGHSFTTQADDWRNIQRVMGKDTIVVFDDYLAKGEKVGWGCHRTIDAIDRDKFNVEFLEPSDAYMMKPISGDERILTATNLVKVTLVKAILVRGT